MLQNRVDPFGKIIRTKARGHWMGNRGILHDEERNLVRPYKLKAWLICLLHFRDRKRTVMSPHRYTELFFLDEATAFAAGHRPCFECRRQDYNRFKSLWLKGNPQYGYDEKTSIQEIDKILHTERTDRQGNKISYKEKGHAIPGGTFVRLDQQACLVKDNFLYHWSPEGYEKGTPVDPDQEYEVLTPQSTVNAFKAGYVPEMGLKQNT